RREDDGGISGGIAHGAAGRREASRWSGRARRGPGRHWTLCARLVQSVATIARDRNSHGAWCEKQPSRLDGWRGKCGAARHRDRRRPVAGAGGSPHAASVLRTRAGHLSVPSDRGSDGAHCDCRADERGGPGGRVNTCVACGHDRSAEDAPARLTSEPTASWTRAMSALEDGPDPCFDSRRRQPQAEDELLKAAAAHAAHDHGITEVSPELAAKVKAAIKSR